MGEADEGVPPEAERHVEAEDRPGHLQGQVADRPPADTVAQRRLQPAQEARAADEGLGVLHQLAQEGAGQAALQSPDPARAADGQREHGQAEEGDGQHHAGHHGDAHEREADHGEPTRHEVERELGPGALGEGFAEDAPGDLPDPGRLLLRDGEGHLPPSDAHRGLALLHLLGGHAWWVVALMGAPSDARAQNPVHPLPSMMPAPPLWNAATGRLVLVPAPAPLSRPPPPATRATPGTTVPGRAVRGSW